MKITSDTSLGSSDSAIYMAFYNILHSFACNMFLVIPDLFLTVLTVPQI